MTEKKEAPKAAVKPKTGKAPAAKEAAPAKKAEAKPAAAPKAAKPAGQKSVADGKVKVTQIQGSIARKWDQEATLKGLGLGKRHRSRVLENTPEVRGMIYKVRHLVKAEKVS